MTKGNTLIVIEHNLYVIKSADWIVGLGPEGGKRGGMVVAKGTPEEVAEVEASFTGQFLGSCWRRPPPGALWPGPARTGCARPRAPRGRHGDEARDFEGPHEGHR